MAKITPGPLAGQISGRLGSAVFSHNKGGPYVRNGTIPTVVTSDEAIAAKARLTAASQSWAGLTDADRLSWTLYAQQNTVLDRLGHQITLSGASMFNRFFCRLALSTDTPLDVAPVGDPPKPLRGIIITAEAATPEISLEFTDTPIGPDDRLIVRACLLESPGVSYIRNRLRYILTSSTAHTSPLDITANFVARFGAPQEHQTLHVQAYVLTSTTGLVSEPLQSLCVVAAGGGP